MADELNPYAAVLADLERERDQINSMILMIKKRMGLTGDEPIQATLLGSNGGIPDSAELRSDTFFGMTIADSIKKYLAMAKRPKRVSEISKALEDGGLQHTSKNWIGTVQTTLSRLSTVVVRVPNGWGLVEWYPGRTFDKPVKDASTKKRKRRKKAHKAKPAGIQKENPAT